MMRLTSSKANAINRHNLINYSSTGRRGWSGSRGQSVFQFGPGNRSNSHYTQCDARSASNSLELTLYSRWCWIGHCGRPFKVTAFRSSIKIMQIIQSPLQPNNNANIHFVKSFARKVCLTHSWCLFFWRVWIEISCQMIHSESEVSNGMISLRPKMTWGIL